MYFISKCFARTMRLRRFKVEINALLIGAAFLMAIYVIINNRGLASDTMSLKNKYPSSLTDYSTNSRLENDAIGVRVTRDAKPTDDNRIFMHETSGRPYLLWRQTCSLESVARSNPSRAIHLYMSTAQVSENETPWMDIVREFRNIQVNPINNGEYFNGSQLDAWYKRGEWQNSPFEISHMSNYIRMVTLSQGGGLYIDLDVIIFKELEKNTFRNVFVYSSELKDFVDTAVFHLETGHRFIKRIIELIANEYDSDDEIHHGSSAVGQVLKDLCGVKSGKPSSNRCTDVTLLPHDYFFAIKEQDWQLFFQKADSEFFTEVTSNYGIHTHLSSTFAKMAELDSPQLLAQLARKYCPSTVSKALMYHYRKL